MPSCDGWAEDLRTLLTEFGVEDLPGRIVERRGSFWLCTAPEVPERVRVHSLGIRLARLHDHGLAPTSFGLMLLGERIKRRRAELSWPELRELLLGRPLRKPGLPQGYVALALAGEVLGCGEVRGEVLRSRIPRGRRQELLVALSHEEKVGSKGSGYNGSKGATMETQEDVLKGAILLEERGKTFYEHAARTAESPGVREIFTLLAREEERHKGFLANALAELLRKGKVENISHPAVDVTAAVLTEEVKKEIEAAGFEAAAIYAGMALEERAVAFYAEKAKSAPPALAELYTSLAKWEQSHLDLLMTLDQDLRQRIWHERGFWPLD